MLRAKKANLTVLGDASQFAKEYAFNQIAMNEDFIAKNPEKATAMLGTIIRTCAFLNDPANGEEIVHVLTKVMRNPDEIGKQMYEIEVLGSKSIPPRCEATAGRHQCLPGFGLLDQVHRGGHQDPAAQRDPVPGVPRQSGQVVREQRVDEEVVGM